MAAKMNEYEVYNNEVVRANMPYRDRLINFAFGFSQGGRPAALMKRYYLTYRKGITDKDILKAYKNIISEFNRGLITEDVIAYKFAENLQTKLKMI
jgi:hypothetical protein